MARSFDIDLTAFIRALESAPEIVGESAKRGLTDAMDAWKREATDIAPIDKGTLRRSITVSEINGSGLSLSGEISANALETSRKGNRFNYAYYIHEKNAGGRKLRVPGTVKKFLDVPAETHGDEWVRGIEAEITDELKRKGW